jgi:hypothetical protein
MNFNVVDGTDEILPREKLSAFEADYLNSELKSVEVRMKYGLSKRQYSEITREIRERYGLIRRPYAQSKHFYQWGNRWHIIKTNKRERVYIGSLPTDVFSKSDIEAIVEKCKELAWNVDECMNLLQVIG